MPAVAYARRVGNRMILQYDDGSFQFLVPAGTFYIPAGTGGDATGGTGGSTGIPAPVDDYPYPTADPAALSPFRYSYRDCTDFVCWRINRDNGDTSAPWSWTWGDLRPAGGNGDAIGWRGDWQILGYAVDINPVAGCIAWYGSSAGEFGHVAYVQSATDGTVVLEEYNWSPSHQAYNTRTVAPTDAYYPDSFLAMPH